MDITPLAYAILGLLQAGPRSGYDLRTVFATTPMTVFSESPGSIYPALQRLRAAGLIEPAEAARGGRRRTAFATTTTGRQALRAWLASRVQAESVRRRPEVLDLRFALMDLVEPPLDAGPFLLQLRTHLEAWCTELTSVVREQGSALTDNGRAGLQLGLDLVVVRLRWVERRLAERGVGS